MEIKRHNMGTCFGACKDEHNMYLYWTALNEPTEKGKTGGDGHSDY